MDTNPPCVSFIGIVDFSEDARWIFLTDSVADLLGYEPAELIGKPSLELAHPDEFARLKQMHYDTISQDKAAVLAYLRLKHKDPYRGYILCGVTRTVVHNVLVGSVSFASPGPKAFHNASTAQEVEIVTPSARKFEFRRWNDPSPMPSGPQTSSATVDNSSEIRASKNKPKSFPPLPSQSIRAALILNRFTINCTVMHCTNDDILAATTTIGRSFYDFVALSDEDAVRSWIDVVKGWGVNERGQPSDGGFGFGRFSLLVDGRDSSARVTELFLSGRQARSQAARSFSRTSSRRSQPSSTPEGTLILVDAIFSAHSDGLLVILRRATPSS